MQCSCGLDGRMDVLCFRITDKAKERGHHMELICKKCLLREMAEADAAMIKNMLMR